MKNIKIERVDGRLEVTSPYDRDFIFQIKQIGGRWISEKKVWSVSEELEQELMDILRDVYGWVGDDPTTIRVTFKAYDFWSDDGTIDIGPMTVAKRYSRDGAVSVADGFWVSGGSAFPSSGGSAKYPSVKPNEDTEMTGDLPLDIYKALSEEEKALIIVDDGNKKKALEEEKEKLLARLAEIEEELAQM